MPDLVEQSGKTLGELMLGLAIAVGLAEYVNKNTGAKLEAPVLPTDPQRLFRLKLTVNSAYKAFLGGIDPLADGKGKPVPAYTNWSFLTRTVTIQLTADGKGGQNVKGDSSRYRLPSGVCSRPKTAWVLNSGGITSTLFIEDTDAMRVQARLNEQTSSTGWPEISCCRPLINPEGPDAGPAWEVVVAPRPTAAMAMTGDFRIQPRDMVRLEERHLAGAQHDYLLEVMSLMEWRRTDDKGKQFERAAAQASQALRASIALDKNMKPRGLGPVVDPSMQSIRINRGQVAAGQRTTVEYVGQ